MKPEAWNISGLGLDKKLAHAIIATETSRSSLPHTIKENVMGWLITFAVVFALLSVICFVSCGEETRKNKSCIGLIALGLVLLAIATLLGGLVFNTAGLGKIAEEYKAGDHIWSNRTLEENVPYFVTGAVKVRDNEHIAFVCEVQNVGAADTSLRLGVLGCADTHDWRAYRFKTPPPELFIKRKDGVIQKITLEEARLLKEVEK